MMTLIVVDNNQEVAPRGGRVAAAAAKSGGKRGAAAVVAKAAPKGAAQVAATPSAAEEEDGVPSESPQKLQKTMSFNCAPAKPKYQKLCKVEWQLQEWQTSWHTPGVMQKGHSRPVRSRRAGRQGQAAKAIGFCLGNP